jgi:uncharacterized membrane protein
MADAKTTTQAGLKYSAVFTAGGLFYAMLELASRGRTHWSMIAAGGICAVLLYLIAVKSREKIWKKWIMGGAVITTAEFLIGIAVNIILGWDVWSYSDRWANLFGQICVPFALIWTLLSVPGIYLMRFVGRRIFKDVGKTA